MGEDRHCPEDIQAAYGKWKRPENCQQETET